MSSRALKLHPLFIRLSSRATNNWCAVITGAFVLTESFCQFNERTWKLIFYAYHLFIYLLFHLSWSNWAIHFYPIQIIAYLSGKIGRITGTWKRTSNEAYFSISKFSIVAVQHSKKYDIVVQKIGKT